PTHQSLSVHAPSRRGTATTGWGAPSPVRSGVWQIWRREPDAGCLRQNHRCGSQRGDAFAPAGEAEALGGGGLDGDAGLVEPQDLGDAPSHGVAMGCDLGSLAENGDVDIADAAAVRAHEAQGL